MPRRVVGMVGCAAGGLESMRDASSSFCGRPDGLYVSDLTMEQEARDQETTFPATLKMAPLPALKRGQSGDECEIRDRPARNGWRHWRIPSYIERSGSTPLTL